MTNTGNEVNRTETGIESANRIASKCTQRFLSSLNMAILLNTVCSHRDLCEMRNSNFSPNFEPSGINVASPCVSNAGALHCVLLRQVRLGGVTGDSLDYGFLPCHRRRGLHRLGTSP